MFTMILKKSRLIDITVTLAAVGRTSRQADYYEIVGITDKGNILLNEFSPCLGDAYAIYSEWAGEEI